VEVEVQMVVKRLQPEGLVEVLVPGAAEVLLTEETKEVTALLKDMQEVLMLMLALDGVVVEGVELVL
jgi:hypothetical protein